MEMFKKLNKDLKRMQEPAITDVFKLTEEVEDNKVWMSMELDNGEKVLKEFRLEVLMIEIEMQLLKISYIKEINTEELMLLLINSKVENREMDPAIIKEMEIVTLKELMEVKELLINFILLMEVKVMLREEIEAPMLEIELATKKMNMEDLMSTIPLLILNGVMEMLV